MRCSKVVLVIRGLLTRSTKAHPIAKDEAVQSDVHTLFVESMPSQAEIGSYGRGYDE